MSEFCLDCWNKINRTNHPARKYIISKELDLCEECGKLTHVIVTVRKPLPVKMIQKIFYHYRCSR